MVRWKKASIWVMVSLLVLLLASCGGGQNNNKNGAGGDAANNGGNSAGQETDAVADTSKCSEIRSSSVF